MNNNLQKVHYFSSSAAYSSPLQVEKMATEKLPEDTLRANFIRSPGDKGGTVASPEVNIANGILEFLTN